jgi:hypothetical protein
MKRFSPFAALFLLLGISACVSVNKLKEIDLENRKVAVMAAFPPSPIVSTNFWYASSGSGSPLVDAIRLGTAAAREVEANRVERKMRRALDNVDVAHIAAVEILKESADALEFQPVRNARDADFVFDIKIDSYGVDAENFDSALRLFINGTVSIYDESRGGRRVWRDALRIRERISRGVFASGGTGLGNIISARELANLEPEELEEGFKRLANVAAKSLARELQQDYWQSRR